MPYLFEPLFSWYSGIKYRNLPYVKHTASRIEERCDKRLDKFFEMLDDARVRKLESKNITRVWIRCGMENKMNSTYQPALIRNLREYADGKADFITENSNISHKRFTVIGKVEPESKSILFFAKWNDYGNTIPMPQSWDFIDRL